MIIDKHLSFAAENPSEKEMSWDEAVKYVKEQNRRLPSILEVQAILYYSKQLPGDCWAIDPYNESVVYIVDVEGRTRQANKNFAGYVIPVKDED